MVPEVVKLSFLIAKVIMIYESWPQFWVGRNNVDYEDHTVFPIRIKNKGIAASVRIAVFVTVKRPKTLWIIKTDHYLPSYIVQCSHYRAFTPTLSGISQGDRKCD